MKIEIMKTSQTSSNSDSLKKQQNGEWAAVAYRMIIQKLWRNNFAIV